MLKIEKRRSSWLGARHSWHEEPQELVGKKAIVARMSLWERRKCCGECQQNFCIGPNDKQLMMTLRNAGTDHRKFMRMITVYLDITAPLYWWKEFDTYKVGTVANSCSTMHKIADKEFTLDDFSYEHLNCEPYHRDWIESATVDEDITSPHKVWMTPLDILRCTIEMLNAIAKATLKPRISRIGGR